MSEMGWLLLEGVSVEETLVGIMEVVTSEVPLSEREVTHHHHHHHHQCSLISLNSPIIN